MARRFGGNPGGSETPLPAELHERSPRHPACRGEQQLPGARRGEPVELATDVYHRPSRYSGVSANAAFRRTARSTNIRPASRTDDCANAVIVGFREAEQIKAKYALPIDLERLAGWSRAAADRAHRGTGRRWRLRRRRGGGARSYPAPVAAAARPDAFDQDVVRRAPETLTHTHRGHQRVDGRSAQDTSASAATTPASALRPRRATRGHLQREPRLSVCPRARDCHERAGREHRLKLDELRLAPDQRSPGRSSPSLKIVSETPQQTPSTCAGHAEF